MEVGFAFVNEISFTSRLGYPQLLSLCHSGISVCGDANACVLSAAEHVDLHLQIICGKCATCSHTVQACVCANFSLKWQGLANKCMERKGQGIHKHDSFIATYLTSTFVHKVRTLHLLQELGVCKC